MVKFWYVVCAISAHKSAKYCKSSSYLLASSNIFQNGISTIWCLYLYKKKDNLIYSFSDNNWFFQLPSLLIMVFELIFIFRSPQFKFNFWQDIALKLFIFKTNLIQSVQGTQKRAFRAIRRTKNTTVGSSRGSPSLLKDDSQG